MPRLRRRQGRLRDGGTLSELRLREIEGRWSVVRLPPDDHRAFPSDIFAMVRTAEELSLVVPVGREPHEARVQSPWRMLMVEGPLDFALTGVIARISAALAEAGIPIFVVSSFDTDYVLLPAERADAGIEVLIGAGMPVGGAG